MPENKTFGKHDDDIMMALRKRGIQIKDPPNGRSYKTIPELIAGINEGGIVWDYANLEDKTLVTRVAVVTVKCKIGGQTFELFEHHRVIITRNSQERYVRPSFFDGTIGEKIRDDETPLGAAMRGLEEELSTDHGLRGDRAFKKLIGAQFTDVIKRNDPRALPYMGDERFADSRFHHFLELNPRVESLGPKASEFWSWLGLDDIYERSRVDCEVMPELFDPKGLINVERKSPTKIVLTKFLWRDFQTKKLVGQKD